MRLGALPAFQPHRAASAGPHAPNARRRRHEDVIKGEPALSDMSPQAQTFAPGERILVRDEQWLVRTVAPAAQSDPDQGLQLDVVGVSPLVRDRDATFFTAIDSIRRFDPANVRLVPDTSSHYLTSRLWLDSVIRRSAIPLSDTRIAAGHRGLFDKLDYQLRPAQKALTNLRPRILIGDAVGLGKTLEIGIVLSELIARGRGERILVVTPRAVLKQFQTELWTRFGIPLVRLDSQGIQRVQRELPAGRNPFSYYKRVIVSIDTLKNPHRYKAYLEKHHWDAVVIDECHNLVNRGTQNNELARTLARNSDALILSSATPHNGKPESFAELIGLLDPTAIADNRHYSASDIEHLYVRRHRGSPEVAAQIGDRWRERAQPQVRPVTPTPVERAVLAELDATWLHPASGVAPVTGKGRTLFPWTLFKGFLSSPAALLATIGNRRRVLTGSSSSIDEGGAAALRGSGVELEALGRLEDLTRQVGTPAKLRALIDLLTEMGIGPRSTERVVVFSERVDTLNFLKTSLPQLLGLPDRAVGLLHAQQSDDAIQETVESFGQKASPLRVLLASDMASEGLNLHKECHLLIHYDVPWSFIRIQQRNGRIDRYGQLRTPTIHALALADEEHTSEVRVVTALLNKEHEANKALGDAGVLMDLGQTQYSPELEEKDITQALARGQQVEDVTQTPEQALNDQFLAALFGEDASVDVEAPVPLRERHLLFPDQDDFLAAIIDALPEDTRRTMRVERDSDRDLVSFEPPPDLEIRLRQLPRELVRGEDSVIGRIQLTGSKPLAEDRLRSAQQSTNPWPDTQYLTAVHPVIAWAGDRGMSLLDRQTVPVMAGAVEAPVFLTQATWANDAGQVVIAQSGAVVGVLDSDGRLRADRSDTDVLDLVSVLADAHLDAHSVNDGRAGHWRAEALARGVEPALAAASVELTRRRDEFEGDLLERIQSDQERLYSWHQRSLDLLGQMPAGGHRSKREQRVADESARLERLIQSSAASGEPYVRLLGVIVPGRSL